MSSSGCHLVAWHSLLLASASPAVEDLVVTVESPSLPSHLMDDPVQNLVSDKTDQLVSSWQLLVLLQ